MLWDTAGQEEFDALTKAYYRGAQVIIFIILVNIIIIIIINITRPKPAYGRQGLAGVPFW